MKRLTILALVAVFATSCDSGKKEIERLQAERDSLQALANTGTAQLDSLLADYNEISAEIEEMLAKRGVIMQSADGKGELSMDQKEKIRQDLAALDALLEDSKRKLAALSARAKNAEAKNANLEKMIAGLNKQIEARDAEIRELKNKLAQMNVEVENLTLQKDALEQETKRQGQEIEKMDADLNTGYYAMGTSRELRDKNIYDGRTISDKFNPASFTKIDIRKTNTISLLTHRVKLVTKHPDDSYEIEGKDKQAELKIKDPKKFWEFSRYCVILQR